MNKDSESKIKKRKVSSKKEKSKNKKFDTLSITMELEKPLDIEKKIKQVEKNKKNKKIIFLIISVFLFCIAISFVFWIKDTYKLSEEGRKKIENSNSINISRVENNLVFTPKNYDNKVGVIFYSGEKIEEESYVGICKKLSECGYKVVIPKMNLNLPVLSTNKANKVIDEMPNVKDWYIIGHQKGGDEASKASINQKNIKGAILLGSYSNNENLKLLSKKALLIWGSKDGIMNFEGFSDAQKNLPKDTVYYEIIGGNTSNFGDYGLQKGDNEALIDREQQQEKAVKKIDEFIKKTVNSKVE